MKKKLCRFLSVLLTLIILLPPVSPVRAYRYVPDLSDYIRNRKNRVFVEAMLSYHLQENTAVQRTLKDGYSALFFFEGCSDNMDNPELADLTYYRVSAVCIALRLGDNGAPEIVYFNENCSTLPDRALEFGAWQIEGVGEVGPATVCDGTYELYSVYHAGSYEALQMRTSYEDESVQAVYMRPDGFVHHGATEINIHTRTGNHTIERAMWSAGCLLVGDGEFQDFADLIAATYYKVYDYFVIGQRVGTVTINRMYLQDHMYALYKDTAAVDALLVSSRCEIPEIYLERCVADNSVTEPREVMAVRETDLMSLPCGNATDPRSIPVIRLEKNDRVEICGSITNTKGEQWYEVDLLGGNGYVRSTDVQDIPSKTLWEKIVGFITGK